jgi:hypothetical protein
MPADASGPTAARLRSGLVSGVAATGAMSVAFGIARLAGAIGRLPPRLLLDRLVPSLPEQARGPLEWALHFGYGAAAGATYAVAARPGRRGALTGTLFGLAVWLVGYEGWVPMVGALPPAHHDRRGRAGTILLAHVVYGAALGAVGRRLSRPAGPGGRAGRRRLSGGSGPGRRGSRGPRR